MYFFPNSVTLKKWSQKLARKLNSANGRASSTLISSSTDYYPLIQNEKPDFFSRFIIASDERLSFLCLFFYLLEANEFFYITSIFRHYPITSNAIFSHGKYLLLTFITFPLRRSLLWEDVGWWQPVTMLMMFPSRVSKQAQISTNNVFLDKLPLLDFG